MESKVPVENKEQYEQINSASDDKRKNRNGFILAGVLIVLCVPVFYLFFSSKKQEDLPKEEVSKQAPTDQLAAMEQAVASNPTFQNYINLGIAYQQNGKAKQSIGVFKKAIELNPSSAVAYNDLGVGYIMTRQFPDAEAALVEAIRLDSTFQLAKNNLAWMNDERKKFMEEISAMEAIADKTPQQYIDLGLKYYAIGEYQKSIDLFNKCLEIDKNNSLAYNNMGTSYMFLKNYEEARKCFNKAIELDGDEQLYKNNLKWAEDESSKNS